MTLDPISQIHAINNQVEMLEYVYTTEQVIEIPTRTQPAKETSSSLIHQHISKLNLPVSFDELKVVKKSRKKHNAYKGLVAKIIDLSPIAAHIFLEDHRHDTQAVQRFKKHYGNYFSILEENKTNKQKEKDLMLTQEARANRERKKIELKRGTIQTNQYRYWKAELLSRVQTNFLGIDVSINQKYMQENSANRMLEKLVSEAISGITTKVTDERISQSMKAFNTLKNKYNIYEKFDHVIPENKMYANFEDAQIVKNYYNDEDQTPDEKLRIKSYVNELKQFSKTRKIDFDILLIIDPENTLMQEYQSLKKIKGFETHTILHEEKTLPRSKITKEAELMLYEVVLASGIKNYRIEGYKKSNATLKGLAHQLIHESKHFSTAEKLAYAQRTQEHFDHCNYILSFVRGEEHDVSHMKDSLQVTDPFVDPSEILENRILDARNKLSKIKIGKNMDSLHKSYHALLNIYNIFEAEKLYDSHTQIAQILKDNIEATLDKYDDVKNPKNYDIYLRDLVDKKAVLHNTKLYPAQDKKVAQSILDLDKRILDTLHKIKDAYLIVNLGEDVANAIAESKAVREKLYQKNITPSSGEKKSSNNS